MKTVFNFMQDGKVFYLATEHGDQPQVRPMGFSAIINDKLYIVLATNMELYSQLVINNKVSITTMVGEEWLRLNGTLVEDRSEEVIKSIYAIAPNLTQMFPTEVIAPFYFKDVTASINSFTAPPKSYAF